jgi:hypothetical protein
MREHDCVYVQHGEGVAEESWVDNKENGAKDQLDQHDKLLVQRWVQIAKQWLFHPHLYPAHGCLQRVILYPVLVLEAYWAFLCNIKFDQTRLKICTGSHCQDEAVATVGSGLEIPLDGDQGHSPSYSQNISWGAVPSTGAIKITPGEVIKNSWWNIVRGYASKTRRVTDTEEAVPESQRQANGGVEKIDNWVLQFIEKGDESLGLLQQLQPDFEDPHRLNWGQGDCIFHSVEHEESQGQDNHWAGGEWIQAIGSGGWRDCEGNRRDKEEVKQPDKSAAKLQFFIRGQGVGVGGVAEENRWKRGEDFIEDDKKVQWLLGL